MGPREWYVAGADQALYQYHHVVGNSSSCWFGLGVYHHYVVQQVGARWYLETDDFMSPQSRYPP